MMKLTNLQKRSLQRALKLDRYIIRKFLKRLEHAAAGFVARYLVGKRRRIAELSSVAKYVGNKRKYPLGPALFFDFDYYAGVTKETFRSIEAAMKHYELNAAQGTYLKTHPLFDPAYYVAQAGNLDGLSPISHFLKHLDNPDLRPTPYFDKHFYLRSYSDVAAAKINPFIHYMRFGRGELRKPHPLIDPEFYLLNCRDAANSNSDPVVHYLANAARTPHSGIHPLIHKSYIMRQARTLGLPLGDREPLLLYLRYGDSHRINPHPLFDGEYYRILLRNSEARAPENEETLLAHFLRTCTPDQPNDPSTAFSAIQYWRRNPDIGSMNPLYHYARYGKIERRLISTSVPDLSDPKIQTVLAIEPTILAPHQDVSKMFSTIYPNIHHPGYSLIRGLLNDVGSFNADTIFLFSAFRRGGAERINLKLVQTILDREPNRRILIILTDRAADEAAHWCPQHSNLRTTTFAHEPELPKPEAVIMLARMLEFMRPYQVINCNSQIGWEAYREYGMPLSTFTKLRASLFCYDYDKFGGKVGYARDYVRDTISYLDLIFVDNERFLRDLADDFSLSTKEMAKLKVLYQPLAGNPQEASIDRWPNLAENVKQPRLLWPMRFHKQKRPDILRELALRMPDVQIDAWVPGGSWNGQIADGRKPPNINMLADTKQDFHDIDVSSYCGMLSTSQWEGLPTIILEGVEAGLPVVSSNVGGVSEAVAPKAGYLVSPFDNIDEYEIAIRALLSDPAEADRRRRRAHLHVRAQHSRAAYHKRLKKLDLLLGGAPHGK